MTDDYRAIKARFGGGRCQICDLSISEGDMIVKLGKWAHQKCYLRELRAGQTYRAAVEIMITEHKIAYGVFGIPEGCKYTFTPGDWLEEVIKHNIASADEIADLRWFLGRLDRDLTD